MFPYSTDTNNYYQYFLADHLGNTRVAFDTPKDTLKVEQQDDYMPFGMEISQGSIANPKNEYLYNKKELQEDAQLYDYGARFYDPIIGRFTTVDPMGEIGRRWSPYRYGLDNPIRFIDPDGMLEFGHELSPEEEEWRHKAGIIGANADGPGPKKAPGPNGIGPKDKTNLPIYNGLPYIALNPVKISSGPTDRGLLGLNDNPGMVDNPYMPTYAEDRDAALTELGFAASEIGGELVGPALKGLSGLFKSAEAVSDGLDSSFSISNWDGYPSSLEGLKPTGPFRLLEGSEYQEARDLANQTNRALRQGNPDLFEGFQIHEIHPVKFGGSPTSLTNKLLLTPQEHRLYNTFWDIMKRQLIK